MQISPLQNLYTNNSSGVNSPSFSAGGKPITLQYIVDKRADLLPPRVLAQAKQLLKDLPPAKQPSLLQLHKELYAPLAECKTLDEAKALFPEFEQIKETVNFSRETVFSRKFRERTDKDFALKVLKDYWYNLK